MEVPRSLLVGVAAAAAAVGIAGCDNHRLLQSQQQTAQTVQPTAPVQQAVLPPETDSEKYAKLANMEAYDQNLLAAHGYRATERLDYGMCNEGAPTVLADRGMHYHSTSTCIEYAAVVTSGANAGQHVHIYMQHHGVAGDTSDTQFTAVMGPAQPAN